MANQGEREAGSRDGISLEQDRTVVCDRMQKAYRLHCPSITVLFTPRFVVRVLTQLLSSRSFFDALGQAFYFLRLLYD